jgi:methanogenic corrinoid protein MtbC1
MPGERDVLSGEIFANYIEIKGWSVYFIGQTVSGEEVIHAIQKNKPQVLVLSIASIASLPEAKALISQIRQFFPKVKVVMEGRAALLAQQKLQSEVDTLVSDFEEGHTKMLNLVMPNA